MYYQILAEIITKVGDKKEIEILDIESKDKLLSDIVIPYVSKESFILDGYEVTKDIINRFKIMTTETSIDHLCEYENRKYSGSLLVLTEPKDILKSRKYTVDVTKKLIIEAREIQSRNLSKIKPINKEKYIDNDKVFIVHGRDTGAKQEVARFIEHIGLKPIILHEQYNSGMTIIEKIEKYTDVGFGIVIYTACDEGHKKGRPEEKKYRARQNVIFEHGYLISKLGRKRVCALVKDEVERPTDISGIIYIPLDDNEGWKVKLAKEMKNSGYDIDLNKIISQ